MRSIPKRKIAPCWIVALLSLAVLGCPALPDGPRYQGAGLTKPRAGGTLMLSDEARVRTLDPALATDSISGALTGMLFDGLYTYDHAMKLLPSIASALPTVSDDGLVFTVPLRSDVRFHHGRLLTAKDVVFSIERLLAPESTSAVVSLYAAIRGFAEFRQGKVAHLSGVSAPDSNHVRIELTRADQSFLHLLAMPAMSPVPEDVARERGEEFARHPVGTGPFRLAIWDPGVRIVVEKNPKYFRAGLPHLDRVVFEENVSSETAFLRFRNGEIDIVTRMPPADRAELMQEPKWKPYVERSPQVDVWALFMNCELAPFDNVHVRRAVAFAIDRERWARARNGSLLPTGQMVPPGLLGYDPNLPNVQRFDPQKAREELRLAGFPDGLPDPVQLWEGDQPKSRVYGALAQADLANVGINVELKAVSFPVYLASTTTRGVVPMFAGGWVMDYPDPANFLGLLHSRGIASQSAANKAFYANPKLDRLLDAALVERDAPRRAALYREANDLVAHDAPWAFFANSSLLHGMQPYVRNYHPHPAYWLWVNDVWLDLPRRRVAKQFANRRWPLAFLSPLEVLR
jgi:peptide/nickel transport system substrate-binding protein